MKLHLAIALGLLAGLALGLVAAATGSPALLAAATGLQPVGSAFVNLLKMAVIPLVVATLFAGVAGMSDVKQLGRTGLLALGFFAATTLVAVGLGMAAMRLLLPLARPASHLAAAPGISPAAPPTAAAFLLGLIPANPFQAAAEGALLPLILFTALLAAATAALPEAQRRVLLAAADALAAALIKLVHWVLWVAPLGVFALAAPVTARSGWAMLQSLAVFVLAVATGLAAFALLAYVGSVRLLARRSPGRFLSACLGAQLIGLTTTSSPASIPAMFDATDRLAVPRQIASLVIPLGASLNRAGSAVFQGAAVIFLAWLYQHPLPATNLGAAVLATFLAAFTVAGVPSASVVSLAPALTQVGLPLDGLGILLGVDRIPDMLRSAVNVTGTITASVLLGSRGPGAAPATRAASLAPPGPPAADTTAPADPAG